MRFLLLLAALLAIHSLEVYGQGKKQVSWKTVDGEIQNGFVTILPRVLKHQDELLLYQFVDDDQGRLRTQENLVIDNDIEWLYNQGDTVLVRHVHNDRSVLMQLLYQGTIQLYRVVQPFPNDQYYLVRDGKWYRIENANPKAAAYGVLRQNCGSLKFPRKVRSDWDASELVRQLNSCLAAKKHYPLRRVEYSRNRIGISYDLTAAEHIDQAINGSLGLKRYCGSCNRLIIDRIQPYYQRYFALQYERQAFRYRPSWSYQLGFSFLSVNQQLSSTLSRYQGQVPVVEDVSIHALYFRPGVSYNTSFQRRFRFFIGIGGIIGVPLYARRSIQLTDRDNTVPELPISELYREILRIERGIYGHWGFQFKLSPQFDLGIRHRLDVQIHHWRYYDTPGILYSTIFPYSTILATDYQSQFQLRFMYRW
ncbi:MAG: hypothetical protein AAFZ63_19450 [Bacteroidota bacterium]